MLQPEPEIDQNVDIQHAANPDQSDRGSTNDQSPYHNYLPNAIWSKEENDTYFKEEKENEAYFKSKQASETFLQSVGHHIEDDLLFMQTTLQEDIKLNNNDHAMEVLEIDDSSWTLDQDIYQNSSNSSSTSTIPTLPDTITSDNRIINEANDFLADEEEQEANNQVMEPHNDVNFTMSEDEEKSKEVPHEEHQDKATIYVPNLAKDTTKKNLLALFRTFGPIKQIHLDAKHGSNGKNAIIIFPTHTMLGVPRLA